MKKSLLGLLVAVICPLHHVFANHHDNQAAKHTADSLITLMEEVRIAYIDKVLKNNAEHSAYERVQSTLGFLDYLEENPYILSDKSMSRDDVDKVARMLSALRLNFMYPEADHDEKMALIYQFVSTLDPNLPDLSDVDIRENLRERGELASMEEKFINIAIKIIFYNVIVEDILKNK